MNIFHSFFWFWGKILAKILQTGIPIFIKGFLFLKNKLSYNIMSNYKIIYFLKKEILL
jgi:hypothetical protein